MIIQLLFTLVLIGAIKVLFRRNDDDWAS